MMARRKLGRAVRLALVLSATVGASPAHAQQKWFGDWVVGCDNLRSWSVCRKVVGKIGARLGASRPRRVCPRTR